jgi:hypothetical protein
VYLFLWTAELEALCNSVSDSPDDPEEGPDGPGDPRPTPQPSSGSDRNSCSGLERNYASGPIGIDSEVISSLKSFSSSEVLGSPPEAARMRTLPSPEQLAVQVPEHPSQTTDRTAAMIVDWAQKRKLQRLRSDRHVGVPEKERLKEWLAIFEARGLTNDEQIFSVLDAARAAADQCGQWRNWAFLTLQIQLSAERLEGRTPSGVEPPTCADPLPEDAESTWAKAKTVIRCQIPEIAFLNWFSYTRQMMDCGSRIEVAAPDEPTEAYLTQEYHHVTRAVLSDLGVNEIRFVARDPP